MASEWMAGELRMSGCLSGCLSVCLPALTRTCVRAPCRPPAYVPRCTELVRRGGGATWAGRGGLARAKAGPRWRSPAGAAAGRQEGRPARGCRETLLYTLAPTTLPRDEEG